MLAQSQTDHGMTTSTTPPTGTCSCPEGKILREVQGRSGFPCPSAQVYSAMLSPPGCPVWAFVFYEGCCRGATHGEDGPPGVARKERHGELQGTGQLSKGGRDEKL